MALFAFSRLLRHYVAFSVFSPTVTATSEYRPLVPGVAFALNPDYGGLILPLRKAYLPELGAVHRPRPDHDVAVRRALAEVSQTPFGRDPFGATLPDVIGHVVLLGDAVLDPGFLDILQSVVGTTLVENAHALNPVFAGAVGMAKYSHEWMDNMDFDVEPAFGCRWQSRLYSVDPKDL
ncbi:hypothetical protein ACHAQA_002850 [Verticillium albo-atrum]